MKKQEQLWFSHDCTTTSNPRMIALISVHGLLGYGRWWRLMEILRNEENYKYSITTKFAYNVLATAFMCTVEEAKDFINNCIEDYELLTTDGEFIWSESLLARMEHLENKRILLSERGKKGAAVTNAKRWRRASQEDNSSSQGDSLTVANVSQDVSNNNTVHNNTRQYKTQQLQQNKTIQNNTTTGNNTLVELEMMKQALLNDKSLFKYHLNNKDITKEKTCCLDHHIHECYLYTRNYL